jgi:hypothetical protein
MRKKEPGNERPACAEGTINGLVIKEERQAKFAWRSLKEILLC